MVTRIFKINENIDSYNDTKLRIEEVKEILNDWERMLDIYGKNIDYFKNMTDEEFKKRW